MTIHIVNKTGHHLEFCCGSKEYLLPAQTVISISVQDEDVLYIDEAYIYSVEKGERVSCKYPR